MSLVRPPSVDVHLTPADLSAQLAADVRIGLILVASVPCTLSTAVLWTRLAGGNEATALLTAMGTTCIS